MTEQSNNPNHETVANVDQNGAGEPSLSDVLARLDSLEQKTDGKFRDFGKDMGKLRERIKAPDTGETDTGPANGGVDVNQLRDMVRFEAMSTNLPDTVRQTLTSAVEGGMSYGSALKLADELKPTSEQSAKDSAPVPPGSGARPAPNPSGMHPTKMSELIAIRRDDKARYAKLMADDTFDPSRLR